MPNYHTPKKIVTFLETHCPNSIGSLLDPSVGEGSLLIPFANTQNGDLKQIVCLDTDSSALYKTFDRFKKKFGNSLELVHHDFIKWSAPNGQGRHYTFDCIVMNPPFSGRNNKLIKLDLDKELLGIDLGTRHIPIEAVFLLRAFNLLNTGGTLMAIVPSSIVSSMKLSWLRKIMMKIGSVNHIHEFASFTFRNVEAKTYAIIFKKKYRSKGVTISSDFNLNELRLEINKNQNEGNFRFDYSYLSVLNCYKKNIEKFPELMWTRVGELAQIYRGSVTSPFIGKKAIHYTDYHNGIWKINVKKNMYFKENSNKSLMEGDLIVKRVGRNCSKSFGKFVALNGLACSDCLLIIRPKQKKWSTSILLAIRLIAHSSIGPELLERGAGAHYLTISSILNLKIPIGIINKEPEIYKRYSNATNKIQLELMKICEDELRIKYKL